MYYTYSGIRHSLSTQLATPKQNTSTPLLQPNQFSVLSKQLLYNNILQYSSSGLPAVLLKIHVMLCHLVLRGYVPTFM
jgi:hypothetical protein